MWHSHSPLIAAASSTSPLFYSFAFPFAFLSTVESGILLGSPILLMTYHIFLEKNSNPDLPLYNTQRRKGYTSPPPPIVANYSPSRRTLSVAMMSEEYGLISENPMIRNSLGLTVTSRPTLLLFSCRSLYIH